MLEHEPGSNDELWYKRLRTFGFTLVGLFLFVWEVAIRRGPERPTYIVAYFALMGLPFALGINEKNKK